MKHLLCLVLLLALASANYIRYPFVMWSPAAFNSGLEVQEPITPNQALDALKLTVEKAQIQTVVVVVKDSMTQKNLLQFAKNLQYIKDKIFGHSLSYMNMAPGFESELLEAKMGSHLNYNLEAEDEMPVLIQQLTKDLSQQQGFKIAVVNVKASVQSASLNSILKEVEQAVEVVDEKLMMVLTGREAHEDKLVNFQQTSS